MCAEDVEYGGEGFRVDADLLGQLVTDLLLAAAALPAGAGRRPQRLIEAPDRLVMLAFPTGAGPSLVPLRMSTPAASTRSP